MNNAQFRRWIEAILLDHSEKLDELAGELGVNPLRVKQWARGVVTPRPSERGKYIPIIESFVAKRG